MGSRPEWINWLQSLEDRLSGQMVNVLRAIQQRQWSEAQITQFFVDARRFGDDFLLNALHNLVASTVTPGAPAHPYERSLSRHAHSQQQPDEEEIVDEDSAALDLELRLGRSTSRCRTRSSSATRIRNLDSQNTGRYYGADTLNLGLATSEECDRHQDSDLLVWYGA